MSEHSMSGHEMASMMMGMSAMNGHSSAHMMGSMHSSADAALAEEGTMSSHSDSMHSMSGHMMGMSTMSGHGMSAHMMGSMHSSAAAAFAEEGTMSSHSDSMHSMSGHMMSGHMGMPTEASNRLDQGRECASVDLEQVGEYCKGLGVRDLLIWSNERLSAEQAFQNRAQECCQAFPLGLDDVPGVEDGCEAWANVPECCCVQPVPGCDDCVAAGTCADSCGFQSNDDCWCDEHCTQMNDCCADKADICDGPAQDLTCQSCSQQLIESGQCPSDAA